jgi:hypothetical protein
MHIDHPSSSSQSLVPSDCDGIHLHCTKVLHRNSSIGVDIESSLKERRPMAHIEGATPTVCGVKHPITDMEVKAGISSNADLARLGAL